MWFGVLGPLLVRDGAIPVDVPTGRQRVLLAALLLHAGEPVGTGALAEVMWDGSPPPGADVTLRSHVLRLRRALGPSAGARLVTQHPGYLIRAFDEEVDVLRFHRLCREGGAAVRAGAWKRADGLLGEALGLWRGSALADVPSDLLLRDEVPGLEEARLQAEEWRADAGLRLGRHDELVPTLLALAAQHPLRERFHAQLMLALYRCGRQAEALAAYQHARRELIDEVGAEPGPELQLLHRQVLAGDPALTVNVTPPAVGKSAPAFPYRGLSAFGQDDAGLFFGREEATAGVLERMSGCIDGAGLIIMSGVSGAGKSSLLRAGVLPGLQRAGLAAAPQATSWPCLVFTPGRNPMEELAAQVAPLTCADAVTLREQLAADPAGFAVTARHAALSTGADAEAGDRRIVLVVDQCEQLFTACESQQEREAFLTALHAAATESSNGQPPALVMLAVRADFEARLADFPQLAVAVQDRYLLTAMTRRQLRLAITQPAAAAGCGVQEDLVQVLLEEAGARTAGPLLPGAAAAAGALPLLSHALDQAWRARARQQLTLADYERAGGIDGAIAASAQRAYQALTPAQQQAARQVFTRLAVPGPDGTDTALPAARAELTAGMTGAQAADMEAVLERFAAERLLTLDADTVAVSHEVLLAAWPLLRDDWLADARADRIVRTRLHAAATEWAQDSRDPGYLYRGSRLDAAAATAARITADPRQIQLTQADTDFLHASHRAGRRRVRTRRQLTAVLLVLLAALTTATITAVRVGQDAAAQRNIAVSRQLISQSAQNAGAGANATASRIDAIAAYAVNPSSQARDALLTAAANPQIATIPAADPAGVNSVTFSPDGKTLATGGWSGVRLWDVATGQQIGKTLDAGDQDLGVAFSPDGKILATAGGNTGFRLWDVATGHLIGTPLQPGERGLMVAFSPDGKLIATVGNADVQLWGVATGEQTGETLPVEAGWAAFSPDGKTLATASSTDVQLWDVATGRQIGATLPIAAGSAAFSPGGKTLVTADGYFGFRLWDVATGRPIGKPFGAPSLPPLGAPSLPFGSAEFSPNGKVLATPGGDIPRLWDVTTGQQVTVPLTGGDSNPISSVTFSPDGKTLATGNEDGTVRLWNVTMLTFRRLSSLPADDSGQIASVALSPDSNTLAVIDYSAGLSETSGVTLWDLVTGRRAGALPGTPGQQVWDIAFSPDSQILATGGPSGVQLWDVATGQQTGISLSSPVSAMVFNARMKTLVTVGPGGTMLWAVTPLSHALEAICIQAGGSLTPANWARYVPADTPYRNPCPRTRTELTGRCPLLRLTSSAADWARSGS